MTERPAAPVLELIHGRRGVATTVTIRATELADLEDELTATRAEAGERYARLLAGARRAQLNLARGWSAGEVLDAMERDLVRGLNQLAAAIAGGSRCPDGAAIGELNHGRAA